MHAPSLRRIPVQQRSADRLERILDACAALLDEAGYDALTTRAVADRAEVPIGSVYRFFAGKQAMAEALAHRNLDAYTGRVAGRLRDLPAPDGAAVLDAVLGEYVAMKRSVPGFTLIDFGTPETSASGSADREVAARLRELLADRLGLDPGQPRLAVACLAAVRAADALVGLAFRTDPAGDPELIEETRIMLHGYLADVIEGAWPVEPAGG
ncbi:TetR family transcriptional regulator [Streptomyces sodiiphilus]|uniref:TetR family transcriptional regulator n=1 Tax=Streptomyces sodiiphilus TaxID=226217 RepID=A0ABP5A3N3_9ACTN